MKARDEFPALHDLVGTHGVRATQEQQDQARVELEALWERCERAEARLAKWEDWARGCSMSDTDREIE